MIQMMKCPKSETCQSTQRTWREHCDAHKAEEDCLINDPICPACVPVVASPDTAAELIEFERTVEEVAKVLCHLFAPQFIGWANETKKSKYLNAARVILSLKHPQTGKPIIRIEEG
jgi:hypothetical protein